MMTPKTDHGLTRRTFVGVAGGAIATSAFGLTASAALARPIGASDVAALEKVLGRKVATPASPDEYDAARFIWNAVFDRHPAIIAPCQTAQDVAACINFAREHGLALSVRSGGHHPAGLAMNDGGLVIDVSPMYGIKVDPENRRVVVGPGVRVGELDIATEPHGLVVPAAACPTVGMGGMTSGGGEGWFEEYGLSIDNLVSAEVVLADGRILHVDKTAEPDLFWAIRGGGGNFGVLTSLEFTAHPVPPLTFGLFAHPLPVSKDVALQWRDHVAMAAPDLSSICTFARKPAPAMLMISKTARPAAEAKAEFDTLRAFGHPVQAMVKPVTLTELQMMGAIGTEAGYRYFAYSHYLEDLPPQVFDIVIAAIDAAPSDESTIVIQRQKRGVTDIPVDATAYPHRKPGFSLLAQARWSEKAGDRANIQWVKDWWQAVLPFATGEVYGNYISDVGAGMAARAYGPNYARLARIKRRYDPGNIFSSTVDIKSA